MRQSASELFQRREFVVFRFSTLFLQGCPKSLLLEFLLCFERKHSAAGKWFVLWENHCSCIVAVALGEPVDVSVKSTDVTVVRDEVLAPAGSTDCW